MKTALLLLTLILSAGSLTWYLQDEQARPCIEDWANHTQALFTDASQYFRQLSDHKKPVIEEDLLDKKLQELLPTENMDLSYRPQADDVQKPTTLALDKPQSGLLPDMFNDQEEAGTSVSGKVHMDDDDKIIGAEVQVAIPTSM